MLISNSFLKFSFFWFRFLKVRFIFLKNFFYTCLDYLKTGSGKSFVTWTLGLPGGWELLATLKETGATNNKYMISLEFSSMAKLIIFAVIVSFSLFKRDQRRHDQTKYVISNSSAFLLVNSWSTSEDFYKKLWRVWFRLFFFVVRNSDPLTWRWFEIKLFITINN